MKRGRDDEKMTGPMFPRLHVNDTEKGGPRAPPRNKMALYEQLSIPSQRFNPGVLPLNHPNNTSSLVLPASSSLGHGLERNFHFPLCTPPSAPTHRAEKFLTRQSEGSGLNNSLAQLEQRKKVGDEDDFIVPVFVQSGTGHCIDKTQNIIDREKLTPFSPTYSGRSINHKNVCDKDPKLITSPALKLRQEVRCDSEECPKVSGLSHSVKSTADPSNRERIEGIVKESNATQDQEYRDCPVPNFSSSDNIDACSEQEFRTRSPPVDNRFESIRDVEKGSGPHLRIISHSREDNISPNEPDNGSEYLGDGTNASLQIGNVDKSDDVSETSMVDSLSGFDISPDDVVGIIGQKHFWKARKAIVKPLITFQQWILDHITAGRCAILIEVLCTRRPPRQWIISLFMFSLRLLFQMYSCLGLLLLNPADHWRTFPIMAIEGEERVMEYDAWSCFWVDLWRILTIWNEADNSCSILMFCVGFFCETGFPIIFISSLSVQ